MAKILLVGDVKKLVESVEAILLREGHEPVVASADDVGLDILKSIEPSVVFLILPFSKRKFRRVVRRLFERGKRNSAHAVLVTPYEVERAIKGLDVGFADYLFEPFTEEELLFVTESMLLGV
ncbi:hypothetical protein ACFL1X_04175 [Candidatus Hydrogenedentota bacterium]